MLIRLSSDQILLAQSLLGTNEAWLWVGSAYSSFDNDDIRILETRSLMNKYYSHVPYGMWVGNKTETEMTPLRCNEEKFYVVDTSWWPIGVYRMNLHTAAGVESPFGSKINPKMRDLDCSWAALENFQKELSPYLHKEENGAGYSIRLLIRPERSIEPFGDIQ